MDETRSADRLPDSACARRHPAEADAQHGGHFDGPDARREPRIPRSARLRDSRRPRPRRHGRRLPGAPAQGQSPRRPEDDPRRRARHAARNGCASRSRRKRWRACSIRNIVQLLRGRRGARPAVLFAGVLRRRHAHRAVEEEASVSARSGRADRDAGAGHALRASARGGASRSETGERLAHGRRHAQDHRFRAGQADRRRGARREQVGRDHGDGVVHGAGAGGRQGARHGAGGRRICAWGRCCTSA